MENMDELKSFVKYLSDISGNIIRSYFRTKISIDSKEDSSPVTIADKKAEEIMRTEIMKKFPEHGIIGEEFSSYNEKAEYKWVLDPIDGTVSFICGAISFGTLIGLLKNGEPVLGVINHPILNEFLIGDNSSAELNGENVRVRNCNNLSDAVLLITDYPNIEKYQDINKFHQLVKKVRFVRGWGDCYGYYLVATGFADIKLDPIMNLWDMAALIPIIKGACGKITDYHGGDPIKGDSIIATSGIVHNEVIKILN
jgi:histidinol phosphatase-like enzyme (inositol monophosphatase family)